MSDEDRLRRESPAYRPEAGWQVVEPGALDAVVSVRFDPVAARRLAEVARATGRTPSRLIRDLTLERLAAGSLEEPRAPAAVRESRETYAVDDAAGFERLRQAFRPKGRIRILMIGELRLASGSFFYRADSNLYRATREAWQAAFGEASGGEPFLKAWQEADAWLYDLAPAPVNRLPGRPRRTAVSARSSDLARLLAAERPDHVVVVKRSLGPVVRDAMGAAELPLDRLHVLPFPLYQWRAEYVAKLSALLSNALTGQRSPSSSP